jgi:hypothetical protein
VGVVSELTGSHTADETHLDTATLREQLHAAQAQNEALLERQRRLMEVLNCNAPEKLEHDLRNVMNELNLLRAIMDAEAKEE